MSKRETALGWVVARAAYPGLVVWTLALADAALARGLAGGAVVPLSFVAALLVVAALERVSPLAPRPRPGRREVLGDAWYLLLAAILQPIGRLGGHWIGAMAALALASTSNADARALGPWWARAVLVHPR